VTLPHEVDVPTLRLSEFRPVIGADRQSHLEATAAACRGRLDGTVVWNLNSTSAGGGVAEMLHVLVGYLRGAGVDARWLVIEGDAEFFDITKRVHNRIHGFAGAPGALGPEATAHYAEVTRANAESFAELVRPGDIVLLHDPQTLGMAPLLSARGARVVWRSHIGTATVNRWTDEAWSLLRPYLPACDAFVFSRQAYVPPWLRDDSVAVIPPSIDPFSAKNQAIGATELPRFLAQIGMTAQPPAQKAVFTRRDGTPGEIVRTASILSEDGPPDSLDNLVVQVSRWDGLKDMQGVMSGFASRVVGRVDAHLALVGPSTEGVADDPEEVEIFERCVADWQALPAAARRRIRLVSLPMDDLEENAAMVNAIQRSATVIVQKSLAEGFGLTVAEGMWKGKPLVASRVGGITDQVVAGTGVLLDDPADLVTFGDTLATVLTRPDEIVRMGAAARDHVTRHFLGDRHLLQWAALIDRLLDT
jgi:trehalose synthase